MPFPSPWVIPTTNFLGIIVQYYILIQEFPGKFHICFNDLQIYNVF